jgi:hypothetical protein
MEENQSYTQAMQTTPVNAERQFAQAQKSLYGGGGIAGSEARGFIRDPYESGGAFDNPMRERERAADPFGLRNVRVDSRNTNRTRMASMEISPPAEVLKAGGIYGYG